ncbi:Cloroperoxidase [Ganoderma leucocontextum]|nr:Cloroperoxidase [Ganoderma leucocontextum]
MVITPANLLPFEWMGHSSMLLLPDASHPYIPPGPDDSRAPCPGLNTLANHGYLPHDGRNLTLVQLVSAIHQVYGISRPLATVFAVGGLVKCGHWRGARRVLDLHDLARHGVLEHDGSLVHADATPGAVYAPAEVDPKALRQLLESAPQGQGHLSLGDLCKAQVARQQAARPLSGTMALVARGELGLIYDVFGVPSRGSGDVLLEKSSSLDLIRGEGGVEGDAGERVVPKAFLEQWLGEERLPDGWEGPVEGTSLVDLLALAKEIGTLEDQMKRLEASAVADSKDVTG